jgi:hypothetical protein
MYEEAFKSSKIDLLSYSKCNTWCQLNLDLKFFSGAVSVYRTIIDKGILK